MNRKRSLLAATFLSAVVAIPVSAGTTESTSSAPQAQASGSAAEVNTSSVAGISTRKFVGSAVNNPAGEQVGEVHDLIIGDDGRVTHAIVDVGGVLGIGEKRVLLTFTELKTDGREGIIIVATREELEAQPAFSYATADGFRISNDETSKPLTPEERQQFVDETERRLDEWGRDVEEFTERAGQEASEASREAGEKVNAAWDSVQQQWAKLKSASVDAWEDAKSSFEETWNEFERTWNDADAQSS